MTTQKGRSKERNTSPFRFLLGPLTVNNWKLGNKGAIEVVQSLPRALSQRRVATVSGKANME